MRSSSDTTSDAAAHCSGINQSLLLNIRMLIYANRFK
jgi:hypothetical protein